MSKPRLSTSEDNVSEHDRLRVIKDQSQACGDFISWLEHKGYILCMAITPDEESDYQEYVPAPINLVKLLAEFFDIDLERLEDERRALLASLREADR